MELAALVFDFDGLILETEGSSYTSWQAAFERHGCPPLTMEEWAAEIGTVGGLDLEAMLVSRSDGVVDVAAMQAARRRHRDELLAAEVARPGVQAWLDAAAAGGLPVAIASSSEYEWVDTHLRRLGLRDQFLCLACHDAERAAKPAPDTYLHACATLGVEPASALAIEDSPHGIRAAKTAGLRVVAVPNPITAQLDLGEADLQLASLEDCSLADAAKRLSLR